MRNIAWTGRSDARLLSPEDLTKVGVETTKTYIFPRRTSQEVSNEVAEAILGHPELFGSFTETKVDDGDKLDFSVLETPEAVEHKATDTPKEEGGVIDTPQTGIDTPTAKRSSRASTANQ